MVGAIFLLVALQSEAVLDCDLATVLLAEEGADNGALEVALVAACDEVGDLEEREGVQHNVQARIGLVGREVVVHGHGDAWCGVAEIELGGGVLCRPCWVKGRPACVCIDMVVLPLAP